jgi:hypothetical protein
MPIVSGKGQGFEEQPPAGPEAENAGNQEVKPVPRADDCKPPESGEGPIAEGA